MTPGRSGAAIRDATSADGPFLEEMLAVAADWRPDTAVRSTSEVLAEPALAHYVEGWPRPGDFGVVAEDTDVRVGAAWCRQHTADDPGYGYVADDVPEVSIGVVAGRRGEGIGRRLMTAVIEAAGARGVDALRLSVEVDNPARRLYDRIGFVVVDDALGAVTMRLDLS